MLVINSAIGAMPRSVPWDGSLDEWEGRDSAPCILRGISQINEASTAPRKRGGFACLTPVSRLDRNKQAINVPCRECRACKDRARNDLAQAIRVEVLKTAQQGGVTLKVALTFSDRYLNGSYQPVQKFFGRLRTYFPETEFRYFEVWELGEKRGRFHRHLALHCIPKDPRAPWSVPDLARIRMAWRYQDQRRKDTKADRRKGRNYVGKITCEPLPVGGDVSYLLKTLGYLTKDMAVREGSDLRSVQIAAQQKRRFHCSNAYGTRAFRKEILAKLKATASAGALDDFAAYWAENVVLWYSPKGLVPVPFVLKKRMRLWLKGLQRTARASLPHVPYGEALRANRAAFPLAYEHVPDPDAIAAARALPPLKRRLPMKEALPSGVT